MRVILVAGAFLTGWIMLSLIGAERHRKVKQYEASLPPPKVEEALVKSAAPAAVARR